MINPFKDFFKKRTLKQFAIYHVRWQTGFIVIYPAMQFGLERHWPFWLALFFSNVCGACIFFFIDRIIFGFKSKKRK